MKTIRNPRPISLDAPPEVSVIIPAYREAESVGKVVRRLREVLAQSEWTHELIVVDDGSEDGTAEAAVEAGARVLSRPRNIGNGAAIKAGLRAARGRYSVLMDADGQHRPEDVLRLLEHVPAFDMVVGARTADSPQSFPRRTANRVYNIFSSYIADYPIEDLTSGFRVIKTEIALRFLYLLPNRFSYPTTITLSMLRAGFAVKYVPVETRVRKGKSKIKPVRDGVRFFLVMFKIGTLFEPLRLFLPVSAALTLAGLVYGAWFVAMHSHLSNGALILLVAGVLSFLLSMVSQQISSLHFIRTDGALADEPSAEMLPKGQREVA